LQEFKDGVWTVKYSLWSDTSHLWDAKRGQPHGPNSIMSGLAMSLQLKIPVEDKDELYGGFGGRRRRESGPTEWRSRPHGGQGHAEQDARPTLRQSGLGPLQRGRKRFRPRRQGVPERPFLHSIWRVLPQERVPRRREEAPQGSDLLL